MLVKGKHHNEIFVFTSRSNAVPFAFLVSYSCFSAAQTAKISPLGLTFASLDNYLVLNACCNFVV